MAGKVLVIQEYLRYVHVELIGRFFFLNSEVSLMKIVVCILLRFSRHLLESSYLHKRYTASRVSATIKMIPESSALEACQISHTDRSRSPLSCQSCNLLAWTSSWAKRDRRQPNPVSRSCMVRRSWMYDNGNGKVEGFFYIYTKVFKHIDRVSQYTWDPMWLLITLLIIILCAFLFQIWK